MKRAAIKVDRDFRVGEIDHRIYGSFIEHLDRAVYGGIYEPGPYADEEGFRKDVIELVKELNVPLVRYPGGNFVSGYNWEDGVGPVSERPVRKELAWHTLEYNTIGTNEFASWAKKAGTDVMMAVNLGTRGPDEARNLLEYCNHPSGTYYSDLRIKHGVKEPHNIKLWCLGNEMDGPWQIGHKTAREYGRIACETARLMKWADPSIELVACGSSGYALDTFGSWEREVLMETYDLVDYLSIHQYFGKRGKDTPSFMACTMDTEEYIKQVIASCDHVMAVKKGKKKINISFDEWNVWFENDEGQQECYYTVEEAVLSGSMLLSLIRHADRVKIGCQAQLVNAIAPIYCVPDQPAFRQTMFYPYYLASKYGRGTTLVTLTDCDKYDCQTHADVPVLDCVAVETNNGVSLFAINRSEEPVLCTCKLGGYTPARASHTALCEDDKLAKNTPRNPERVTLHNLAAPEVDGDTLSMILPPLSFNLIRA